MASDLSSGCTETAEVLDEKEEGEISLEDVSSSEEGHLNYGYGIRIAQCPSCLSTQHCAAWCTAHTKLHQSRNQTRREVDLIPQDAVQGKENRHHVKESGSSVTKHAVSTLQEKNDDLVPISSDSDMEIVGLADNSKQIVIRSSKVRVKKKRKKKRTHTSALTMDDLVSSSSVDLPVTECVSPLKHGNKVTRSHHREVSPTHRSNRPRLGPRLSPRRHRSPVRTRSPFTKSRSPIIRNRSPIPRRSPRRHKSPKRSPCRSPTRTVNRKTLQHDLSATSDGYTDVHGVTKLLKKVRQLDSMGTHSLEATLSKNREHASSLKEKLSHMMKGLSDNNGNVTFTNEKFNLCKQEINDADDEEDLALLRQKALETKQKKLTKKIDQPKSESLPKTGTNTDDDQDEEDLELRMIALRSAVLKKHQNRLQKGVKSGKQNKCAVSRSESPFTQSFLDSIPIPGEELLKYVSPPCTPPQMIENNHTEDMDIDTDVEREKEKLPYSPTDKITVNMSIDTELLGIQSSDVSFISLDKANSTPAFTTDAQKSLDKNRTYLTNVPYYSLSQSLPYSPTDPIETLKHDFLSMKKADSHLSTRLTEECNVLINTVQDFLEMNCSQEMPYSPTDTPVYDPDLMHTIPQTSETIATSNSTLSLPLGPCSFHGLETTDQYSNASVSAEIPISKHISDTYKAEHLDNINVAVESSVPPVELASPASLSMAIDDLPEIDGCPLDAPKSMENIPNSLPNSMRHTSEPLYMKGVPDVTKDVNKIPTVINRILVPVSILKSNKQLQQPLPAKKHEVHSEPTFKSAKMQPVSINTETTARPNALFKPMKLVPFAQKPPPMVTTPTVFHESLLEDTADESAKKSTLSSGRKSDVSISAHDNVTVKTKNSYKTGHGTVSRQRRKRLNKKGAKRKSISKMQRNDSLLHTIKNSAGSVSKRRSSTKRPSREDPNESNKKDIKCENKEGKTISAETSSAKKRDEKKVQDSPDIKPDNRRQSLDEDEEALRAILLASLPKRTKVADSVISTSTSVATSTPNNSKQIAADQNLTKPVSPVISTIGATNKGTMQSANQHSNLNVSESEKIQPNSETKMNGTTENRDLSTDTVATAETSGRKRPALASKGPQKKLPRKISIPASTKVVNNAKKYQNAIVQKRLNLQKASTLYGNQKIAENKSSCKTQLNEKKWSTSTKSLITDTQRIVINLESDTDSDSEPERTKLKPVTSSNSAGVEKPQPVINSTAEFEKNLDQFLRDVRKKQESVAAARPTSLMQVTKKDATSIAQVEKKNSSNLHTPLAVYLPASQQEEYRRLKQQILEREKLKLSRTTENNSSAKNKPVGISSKPSSINTSNKEVEKQSERLSPKNTTTQQLQNETTSKNLSSTNCKTPLSNDKSTDPGKPLLTNHLQPKPFVKPLTNLSIRVSNENVVSPNNIGNRIVETVSSPVSASRTVTENTTPLKEIPTTVKISGLKILSKDEVNRKYVQIQVNQDTNERVVIINDNITLNENAGVNQNEQLPEVKNISREECNDDFDRVQNMEKEIDTVSQPDDEEQGSMLSVTSLNENQSNDAQESYDPNESVVLLSEHHGQSQVLTNTESNERDRNLLAKNDTSDSKGRIEENWDVIKKDVRIQLNSLMNLSQAEQQRHLQDTEHELVKKRYTILDELTEMSGNLREWHMERDLQTNLVAEVKKLREQLKVAEKRLQMQRNRINSIGPKVVAAHGKINVGRQECFKLSKVCTVLGTKLLGEDYKIPEAGQRLLDNKIKEVAIHTRQLSRKIVPSIDIPEMLNTTPCAPQISSEQTKECLPSEDNSIDNNNSVILIENEHSEETTQVEGDTDAEPATSNLLNSRENETVISDEFLTQDNDQSISEQDNNVLNMRPELFSTPTVSKDCHDLQQEDLNVRPSTSSNLCTERNNFSSLPTEQQIRKELQPYVSILKHFKVARNTNPNGVLCPYELMGTCNDGDCQFVHQSESQTK